MSNPYRTPQGDDITESRGERWPILPTLGLAIGALLVIGMLGSLIWIAHLYVRYPDLMDPPATPVHYWPEVSVVVHAILSGVFAILGAPILGYSLVALRRRRC